MNRKQFILLLLAGAVVGGAGLVLVNRDQQSWSTPQAKLGDKVFANFVPTAASPSLAGSVLFISSPIPKNRLIITFWQSLRNSILQNGSN